MSMADGYAQASGNLAVLNLHVAPGLGNAMGMLYDAMKANAPVLVTAGQQDNEYLVTEPVSDRRSADLGAAVRQMGRRSASRRRSADLRASRDKNRAGAADRPGVLVAARRHPQERRRHRHARTDAHRAAHARRCRRGRRRGRVAGQGRAAGHHRRRRRGAEPRAQRARRTRRGHRRAGLCRVHPEHRLFSGIASALSRHDDPHPGGRARGAGKTRFAVFGRRRFVHLVVAVENRSLADGPAAHSSGHRPLADRQELSGQGRDPRRSEGDLAGHHRGRRHTYDRERQERCCSAAEIRDRDDQKRSRRVPRQGPRHGRQDAGAAAWHCSKRSAPCCRRTPW